MTSDGYCMIEKLLDGNRKFRDLEFVPNIDHYRNLAKSQKPTMLWIGCSDSRIQVGHITQARAGELFIMRNVGNIVPAGDPGIEALLEFALVQLNIAHIAVCGHSNCASIRALDREPADAALPHWLDHAREAKVRVDARIRAPETIVEKDERYRLIEQENVRLQIEHLHTYPLLREALGEKHVETHGLYYDLATGELTRVT
jgi:carbonic anhydrase